MYNYDTFILKRDANKTYISENKYKKIIISTAMVLFVKKSKFYIDYRVKLYI